MVLALVLLCCATQTPAKISEKDLGNYNSIFLSKLIDDNPDYEQQIRKYMNGMIMDGHMGIRLIDKFGLFMNNMEKKGIEVAKIRFFCTEMDVFIIFFVMKDRKDEQLYTMYLEYEYKKGASCYLKDIYFSVVFEERMKEIKNFFEIR